MMTRWYITKNGEKSAPLDSIPVREYDELYRELSELLKESHYHIGNYFAHRVEEGLQLYILLLNDWSAEVMIASHILEAGVESVDSLARVHPELSPFEREIAELYGVNFLRSPWAKPLRFPHNRADQKSTMDNYPFYTIAGDSLHEVNVGPIHAGIIEPGAFRFLCNGERVLHLEIALGYQHRGVEQLMVGSENRLKQHTLAESVAGDSVVAHTSAYASLMERFNGELVVAQRLEDERTLALELERIAVHIADTGALCADIGHQLGQVASEALRTIVINTTQLWCGNRFAKGLIRAGGSHFPMKGEVSEMVLKNIKEVKRRYVELIEDLKSSLSLISRFEDCGVVARNQLVALGAVGMAARSGGVVRDIRATHPWGAWGSWLEHTPVVREHSDVMSRLLVRVSEVVQSADYIPEILQRIMFSNEPHDAPNYSFKLEPNSLSFSLVEGWRGEICHVAITDDKGELELYKIKDPSVHNWSALEIVMRGEGISDFPINNKSYNLSYCGHDL